MGEIVCGEPYGAASDAWAFGACLYELASLRRPFEAGNQLALVRQIVEKHPQPLPASISPEVARAIMGLLEKDAASRLRVVDALSLLPLPPAPSFPPPAPPASSRSRNGPVGPVGDSDGLERKESNFSQVSEEELHDVRPRDFPRSCDALGLSPRVGAAFVDPDEEKAKDKQKTGGRGWFSRLGIGLRSARGCEGEQTVISAFSDDEEGGSGPRLLLNGQRIAGVLRTGSTERTSPVP